MGGARLYWWLDDGGWIAERFYLVKRERKREREREINKILKY